MDFGCCREKKGSKNPIGKKYAIKTIKQFKVLTALRPIGAYVFFGKYIKHVLALLESRKGQHTWQHQERHGALTVVPTLFASLRMNNTFFNFNFSGTIFLKQCLIYFLILFLQMIGTYMKIKIKPLLHQLEPSHSFMQF